MVLMQAARHSGNRSHVRRHAAAADERFPTLPLLVLAICRLAEPVALTTIFPIAFPMVKGFGVCAEKDVAFYAGILVSSFAFAEALTGCFWGSLSDRIGRKPVLLLGSAGTMLSMLLFGISTNYWCALAARTAGGVLNGNVGVIQTMVGELVKRPEHEPRAYAIMPFVWSIGTILGPAVAALTANSSLFPALPYLLPNLICAAMLLLSIIIGYFFLDETLQTTWDSHAQADRAETESILAVGGATTDSGADLRHESYLTFNVVAIHEDETPPNPKVSELSCASSFSAANQRALSWQIVMLVTSLGLYCYHSMAFNDLFPIFAQDNRPESGMASLFHVTGGLGLSTRQVGVILSVNGVISLFIQGVLFPLLATWLGVWPLFRVCIFLFPAVYFVVPYITLLPPRLLPLGIYSCLATWDIFNIILYPLLLILIKEAANPKYLGKINGFAASVGAIARCLAPPIVGWFYSIGFSLQFTGLAWWTSGAVAVLGVVQLACIQRDQNANTTVVPLFTEDENEKAGMEILVEEV